MGLDPYPNTNSDPVPRLDPANPYPFTSPSKRSTASKCFIGNGENEDTISVEPKVGKLAPGMSKKITVSIQFPNMEGALHGTVRVRTALYLFELPITCNVVLDRFPLREGE